MTQEDYYMTTREVRMQTRGNEREKREETTEEKLTVMGSRQRKPGQEETAVERVTGEEERVTGEEGRVTGEGGREEIKGGERA